MACSSSSFEPESRRRFLTSGWTRATPGRLPGWRVALLLHQPAARLTRCRLDVVYPVRFYGSVEAVENGDGTSTFTWEGGDIVEALAHDIPVPGCNTRNCNNIRCQE